MTIDQKLIKLGDLMCNMAANDMGDLTAYQAALFHNAYDEIDALLAFAQSQQGGHMGNTQSKKNFYLIMTAKEYQKAMDHYDLPPIDFAEMIGVSWRQGERYRHGAGIPDTVAKLIRTIMKHKLKPEEIG